MSAVIKTRRRKNLTLSTAALWIVLGFAALFFLVSYGQELLLAHSLTEQAALQRQENAGAQDENTRLKAMLQYYQSDKYVEQRAREDLNLRRSDEEVLIPIVTTPSGQQDSSQAGGVVQSGQAGSITGKPTAHPTPQPERANWQKWLELFSPGP